jgi:hypothetical protein
MTQPSWDCTQTRVSLGVYVLGAIDPAERSLVDAHLVTCRDCRDELAGLAGIPALLARVGPEEISRIMGDEASPAEAAPPPELIATVLDLGAARRRRTRWRYAAAAAAVVALGAGIFGGLAASVSPSGGQVAYPAGHGKWETDSATTASDVSATISYAGEDWGTALEVKVKGIPPHTTCQLLVEYDGGTWVESGTWTTADDEGHVWYPGSAAVSAQTINAFKVMAGKRTLVTVTAS